MKKTLSFLLVVCLVMAFSTSALAAEQASLNLSGGLYYDASVGSYMIEGRGFGAEEEKVIMVTLYKLEDSDWVYVDNGHAVGSESTVVARKYVTLQGSGEYKVTVYGITDTHNGNVSFYYTV